MDVFFFVLWLNLAGKDFKTSMDFWNVNADGLSRLKSYQHFNFHSKVSATPKTLPNTTVVEERKILWKRTLIYFWWTGFYIDQIDVWELYCLHLSHLQEAFCNRISTIHQTKLLTVNIPPPTELLRGLEWWRLKIVTMILQLFSPFLLLSYHFTFTTEIMYTLYVVLVFNDLYLLVPFLHIYLHMACNLLKYGSTPLKYPKNTEKNMRLDVM